MTDIKLGKQSFSERGILKEKNDCTVRALSESLDIPYLTAYGMAIGGGRKRYRGFDSFSLFDSFSIGKHKRPNMIVENYVRLIANKGNWIIWIRGHVFAVVEGEIKDIYPERNLNCHVLGSWRMK